MQGGTAVKMHQLFIKKKQSIYAKSCLYRKIALQLDCLRSIEQSLLSSTRERLPRPYYGAHIGPCKGNSRLRKTPCNASSAGTPKCLWRSKLLFAFLS